MPISFCSLLGQAFSRLRIEIPTIPVKMIESVGATATPLALLVVGAGFEGTKALAKIKPTLWATAIKLVFLPAVFLPLAIALGLQDAELVAALIMLGSPTTVSCYVMAKNMGHRGVLTSNVVMLATVLSSVSLTLWIFLLRLFGLL